MTTCCTPTATPFELGDLTMLIGPDRAARLIEVGVATADGIDFIVHAMPARAKYLEP
ncbi:MAG: toxin-antitoxin system toxin subunit [Ilumatobacteraceae bacterium]